MANEFKIKKGLIVTGADGGTVVDIQGSQGQLFSVTDDLSGSIFAVSDISGVPILDVNSSGTVTIDGLLTGDDATFSKRLTLNSPDYAQHLTMRRGIYGYDTIITGDRVDFSPTADTLNFKFLANLQTTGDVTLNNELNFTGSSYQISGGSSVGDMRFVAPRFRFYENTISGAAKLEIDGGNATFAAQAFSAATSSGDASSTLTTKGYVDGLITGATIYRGAWQAGISATSSAATTASTTLTVTAAILDADGNTPVLVGAVVTGEGITGIVKVASVTSSTVYVLDTAITATATAYIFSPIYGAPDLSGVTETSGYYYICSEAGSATPNGADSEPNTWNVGDWCIYNDVSGTGQWQKIDNSSVLSGAGTGQTVALWEGPSSVTDSDTLGNAPITVSGNDTTFAGNVNVAGDITIDNSSGDPFLKLKTAAQEYVVRIDQSDTEKFQIRDTTNSATRLTIDSTGNVGIDTDSPSYKLDVDGDIRARDAIRVYGNTVTTLPYNSPSEVSVNLGTYYNQYAYIDLATSHAGGSWIDFSKADGTDYGGRIRYANSSDQFQFFTNNSKKMVIDSAGNVGIGTDSPSQKLTISQNATGTGQGIPATTGTTQNGILRLEAGGTYGECLDMGMNVATTYAWIQPVNKGNLAVNYNLALNPNGGNVGIGTTSPKSTLNISQGVTSGAVPTTLTIENTDANILSGNDINRIDFFANDSSVSGVAVQGRISSVAENNGNQAGLSFSTYNTTNSLSEKLRITNSGKVGIGTDSPIYKLDVAGEVRANNLFRTTDGTNIGLFGSSVFASNVIGIGSSNAVPLVLGTGATERMRITSGGNVGIGTTSPDLSLTVKAGVDSRLGGIGWESNDGVHEWSIDANNAGNFRIYKGTTAVARFDSSGNFGIGTTSPGHKLDVYTNTDNGYVASFSQDNATGWGVLIDTDGVSNNDPALWVKNATSTVLWAAQSGNVGIGTTNPRDTLEIVGNMRFVNGEDHLMIKPNNAIHGADFIVGDGVDATDTPVMSLNGLYGGQVTIQTQGNTIANKTVLDVQGTQGQLFSVTDNLSGDIFSVADISGVPIMNVNSDGTSYFDGNVGIGTASPDAKVEISQSSSGLQYEALRLTNTADSGNMGAYISWHDSYSVDQMQLISQRDGAGNGSIFTFNQRISGALSPALVLKNGNVGIGTTTPGVKLQVNGGIRAVGTTSTTGQIDASPDFGAFRFYNGNTFRGGLGMGQWASVGNNADIVQYLNNVNYYISNGATALVKVEAAGNVGIGTTSPGYKLTTYSTTAEGSGTDEFPIVAGKANAIGNFTGIGLSGYIGANGAVKAGIVLERVNSYGTGKLHILNNSTSTSNADATLSDSKITILGNGDVGIGTTSPAAKLDIQGTQGQLFSVTDNLSGDIFSVADISGVPIMNVNSDGTSYFDGNVGIGTDSPGAKLEVQGTNTAGDLALSNSSTIVSSGDILGKLAFRNYDGSINFSSFSGEVASIRAVAAVDFTGLNGANTDLLFYTNSVSPANGSPVSGGSEKMRILANGNVGIGTTGPDYKLDVDGDIRARDAIRVFGNSVNPPTYNAPTETSVNLGTYINDYAYIDLASTNAGGSWFDFSKGDGTDYAGRIRYVNSSDQFQISTAGSQKMVITSAGNVGIGTTSPNAKLEVIGTSYLRGNTYTDILQPYTGQQLTLLGGGANTLFVNGKVGIGTTSPDTKLDVISGTNNGIRISATDTTDNWRDINIRSYVSQAQANALPSGSAIYTTNPSSQSETAFSKYGGLVLQGRDNGNSSFAIRLGNGNGYATRMFMGATGVTTFSNTVTATNFILSSDERKKTKIKDLTCDNINVNWKSFELKEDEGEYRTGVIAQELEQSHPEFVKTDDEGFKSVKYIDLLIAKIAELEARLEKLEK